MSISGINARNQIKGIVQKIRLGDSISEVELDTPAGIVTSVVATSLLQKLDLKVGSEALAVIKATEVSLAKPLAGEIRNLPSLPISEQPL